MHDQIQELLEACRSKLDWIVSLVSDPWLKDVVRGMLSPLYDLIDMLEEVNNSGGNPDNLYAAGVLLQSVTSQLESFREVTVSSTALHAMNQPATWDDPNASGTYFNEFRNVQSALKQGKDWSLSLAAGLIDQSDISDDFYDALYAAVLGFAAAVGGMCAAMATAAETAGVGAVVSAVVSTVGVLVAGVSLTIVFNTKAATIKDVCRIPWPRPVFADY